MSNVSEFSTTAASNNSASPNGFPESMPPSGVNDSARELMAGLAKWYKDLQGTITTGGTTTAYTLTTNNAHAALDDIGLFAMQINAANTGSATLNVDSLGAKTMQINGANLAAGDLATDEIVLAVYNPDNDVFDIFQSGASLLDEDDMASDSASRGATQQSIKYYVDNATGSLSGLVFIEAQTISSSTALVEFTSGITGTYDEYMIQVTNCVPVDETSSSLVMQFSADGGSSYDSTASHHYVAHEVEANTGATNVSRSTASAAVRMSNNLVGSDTGETGASYKITLRNMPGSGFTSGEFDGSIIDTDGYLALETGAFRAGVAQANDAVKLYFLGTNIESGKFKLYGVRKTA